MLPYLVMRGVGLFCDDYKPDAVSWDGCFLLFQAFHVSKFLQLVPVYVAAAQHLHKKLIIQYE
jgi:hypothetical protein